MVASDREAKARQRKALGYALAAGVVKLWSSLADLDIGTVLSWQARLGRAQRKAGLPTTEDIDILRADLRNRLEEDFVSFAAANARSGRKFQNDAKQALQEDLSGGFYSGYVDTAGEGAETDDEDEEWLSAKLAEQQDYLDSAFDAIRESSDNETVTEDDLNARAEKWVGTLDGVYSEGRLRGSKNLMCYFDGDDGKETCDTCQALKAGPARSVKWILSHQMNPYPGNTMFACGCWHCEHNWFSVKTGEQVTF